MFESTDVIFDKQNGLTAIVLNVFESKNEYGNGILVCYLTNKSKDDIDNIQFISKLYFEMIAFYRKPNLEDLKQYVSIKKHLLDREIEIYERDKYNDIDVLISNLKAI